MDFALFSLCSCSLTLSKIFFFFSQQPPPETTRHHQERPTTLFSDLDPPRPATTKERPMAWLSSQICNHRGHAVKHGPPRREAQTTTPRSTDHHATKHEPPCCADPNGLEVVEPSDLHGGFWLLRFAVVFGSDLHDS